MCRDSDAAAQMGCDQIYFGIFDTKQTGDLAGCRLMGERLPLRQTFETGETGYTGDLRHFIDTGRIGDIGVDTGQIREMFSQDTADVGDVFTGRVFESFDHQVVDLIGAALDAGREETASAGESVEVMDIDAFIFQTLLDTFETVFILIIDRGGEAGNHFRGMLDGELLDLVFIFIYSDFGGVGAGV